MSTTSVIVVMMVFIMSCVLIVGGGAAAWWFWNKKGPTGPSPPFNNVTPPSVPGGGGPPSSSVPGGPPSSPPSEPSVNIPVKTGSLTADVHILEESEAEFMTYDGFNVWTPKELLDPSNLIPMKPGYKDFMGGLYLNKNAASVGPEGYVVKEWDPATFWPEWAKEDYEKNWPRNKKFRFTYLYVRVLDTWYVVPRYDFLGEELANKRLATSARILSLWHEGMKATFLGMLKNQDKMKPEYRFTPEEKKHLTELTSGKAAWQYENLPTEWFGLGGGFGSAHVFPLDIYTKDPKEFAEGAAWIAIHEDCHCACVSPDCSDSCAEGHSTRWQQLEYLCVNWLQHNNILGYKKEITFEKNPGHTNCFGDTSKCNPQPKWLPVEKNANGGTACDVATNKQKSFDSFF
jgi:hypothetical protein